MTHHDVAVIGAGPAGAIAATGLARRGLSVVLVDPGPQEGPRIGETLPAFAADMLARHDLPGPLDDPRHRPISGVVSAWDGPAETYHSMVRPGGPDWRLDREAFDAALVAAAVKAGSELLPHRVLRVERCCQRWVLTLNGRPAVTTSFAVDATGRRSVVARSCGITRIRHEQQIAIWAVGVSTAAPALAATRRTLIEADRDGWWYGAVLPSDRPIACFHTSVPVALALRRMPCRWHDLLARTKVLARWLEPAAFAAANLHFVDATGSMCSRPAGASWAACGDAAIAFDPIVAQGLLNAVRTGLAAAAALTTGEEASVRYCAEMHDVWAQYQARHSVLRARMGSARQR